MGEQFSKIFLEGEGGSDTNPNFQILGENENMMVDLAVAETDSKPERQLAGTDCLGSVHSAGYMAH